MINIATDKQKVKNSMSRKVFNSSPIDFKGVDITGVKQISYTNFEVSSNDKIETLIKKLKNSNPTLKFVNSSIIGDSFYDNEESELINKPKDDIWTLTDLGKGVYSVTLK